MDLEKYEKGILKTGFVLENRIAQALKKHGWSVISNKYYEDDFEDKIREIDLIAYKVGKIQHFDVYTCLIVSCKKSESNIWALLCRDLNLKDPNLDLRPLHSWSNQPSIQYQLSSPTKAQEYYSDMLKRGVKDALADPIVDIFAFQEMNSVSGLPQNQQAIYDSIISLIKAQSYEMSALPERKKAPCVYQFNLLSVVAADIVRLHFNGNKISSELTTSEHHVSRYILKRKQSFSKIRFINASVFESTLEDYEKLHKANLDWYSKTCDNFYDGIEKDQERIKLYINDFKRAIHWKVRFRTYILLKKHIDLESVSLIWIEDKKSLMVYLEAKEDGEIIDIAVELNGDNETEQNVAEALKKIYRYTGAFYFEAADIPF
jgi:hypothetical protein